MKHGWVPALVLTALALSGGCRVGYDELKQLGFGDAGGEASGGSAATPSGGTGGRASGGASGGSQGGSTQGGTAGTDGGEAGDVATGGTTTTGGTAGSSTGGGGTTGGTGAGRGGTGGAGSGGGGTAGSAGSTAGGGSGGTGAGTGGGGAGGAGTGGAGTGGASGAGGSGGSAGAPNPALCNTDMFGGHTYLLCKEERTWALANAGCITAGMRLVRIEDALENQWLFDNAFTEQGRGSAVWIGATDQAVEGEWRWTDGALFWIGDDGGTAQNGLFAAWYQREPNNVSMAEHCAVLETTGSNPEWWDFRCELVGPFICESL